MKKPPVGDKPKELLQDFQGVDEPRRHELGGGNIRGAEGSFMQLQT